MNIRNFAVKVAKKEGKKRQVNIAQILEILKIINQLTKKRLYTIIRAL